VQGPAGPAGSSTTWLTEFFVGQQGGQTVSPLASESTTTTPFTIQGASLTALVQVAKFNLPAGDFVLDAVVDLQPTLAIGQHYTCQLQVAGRTDLIDSTPVEAGSAIRLPLTGLVHLDIPSQIVLSCGADAPAQFIKGKIHALRVDVLNPLVTIAPGQ
jgi:hypothetical protein